MQLVLRWAAFALAGVWVTAGNFDPLLRDEVRAYTAFERIDPADDLPRFLTGATFTYRMTPAGMAQKDGWGRIREFRNCEKYSLRDWQCTFDDGSGRFGMKAGLFYDLPPGITFAIPQARYHWINCQWGAADSFLQGFVNCALGPVLN